MGEPKIDTIRSNYSKISDQLEDVIEDVTIKLFEKKILSKSHKDKVLGVSIYFDSRYKYREILYCYLFNFSQK